MAAPLTSMSAAPAPAEDSPLMQLPAELRNHIYRNAIVESHPMTISSSGFEVPALLTVSKQVRSETITLFYTENTFQAIVNDYDFKALARWENNILAVFREHRKTGVSIVENTRLLGTENANWNNVLCWMKMVHDGTFAERVTELCTHDGAGLEDLVINAIYAMLVKMSARPWSEVEETSKHFRLILAKIDPLWNK